MNPFFSEALFGRDKLRATPNSVVESSCGRYSAFVLSSVCYREGRNQLGAQMGIRRGAEVRSCSRYKERERLSQRRRETSPTAINSQNSQVLIIDALEVRPPVRCFAFFASVSVTEGVIRRYKLVFHIFTLYSAPRFLNGSTVFTTNSTQL
ncbi:hypothetical protein B0F90DRAFT_1722478 [Multifurca ochricompacta]|uniref:Uncharacterized protein n=1 Tax=Multifurca ochricompacta TaxID=376703 RepID=A0AAD4M3I8_9AGAM|nr:hypothetical protein B0F90DRAFT_1722478 [Multifurca ochricompacta]